MRDQTHRARLRRFDLHRIASSAGMDVEELVGLLQSLLHDGRVGGVIELHDGQPTFVLAEDQPFKEFLQHIRDASGRCAKYQESHSNPTAKSH